MFHTTWYDVNIYFSSFELAIEAYNQRCCPWKGAGGGVFARSCNCHLPHLPDMHLADTLVFVIFKNFRHSGWVHIALVCVHHPSVSSYICISVCLSFCLSVCLHGCTSVFVSVYVAVHLYLFLSVDLSFFLSVCLSDSDNPASSFIIFGWNCTVLSITV